jgi:hypothetical protein
LLPLDRVKPQAAPIHFLAQTIGLPLRRLTQEAMRAA